MALLVVSFFQLQFPADWLEYDDELWVGLTKDGKSIVWAVYLAVVMQLLALFQRQSELALREIEHRSKIVASIAAIVPRRRPWRSDPGCGLKSQWLLGCAQGRHEGRAPHRGTSYVLELGLDYSRFRAPYLLT